MTTFNINNTFQEDADTVVIFVGFTTDEIYREESFRFPLETSVLSILQVIQERAKWFDDRKNEKLEQYVELVEDLIPQE
jgi:hypothetical protein